MTTYTNTLILTDQVREDEVGGKCRRRARKEKCIQNFARKALAKHRHNWEANLEINIKEIWIWLDLFGSG
jgi:hypothetical protein